MLEVSPMSEKHDRFKQVRLSSENYERLLVIKEITPYRVSITELVNRAIELSGTSLEAFYKANQRTKER